MESDTGSTLTSRAGPLGAARQVTPQQTLDVAPTLLGRGEDDGGGPARPRAVHTRHPHLVPAHLSRVK